MMQTASAMSAIPIARMRTASAMSAIPIAMMQTASAMSAIPIAMMQTASARMQTAAAMSAIPIARMQTASARMQTASSEASNRSAGRVGACALCSALRSVAAYASRPARREGPVSPRNHEPSGNVPANRRRKCAGTFVAIGPLRTTREGGSSPMKEFVIARVKLPFGPVDKPKALAALVIEQVTVVEQAPDYNNQLPVQTAAAATLAAANAVAATETSLANLEAQRINLETTRGTQIVTLQLAHDGLRTSMNNASKGNLTAAKAWTGALQTRTRLDTSTAPPTDPTATPTTTSGMVRAKCKAEKGVVCYLFQHGTTPTSPDTWPTPAVISGKCSFDLPGQALGTLVYLRIAVVRKNGGQGAWSNVLEVTVK